MTSQRVIRVDSQFFIELDAQLGDTRGANGEPSSSDFLLIDLPPIAEVFLNGSTRYRSCTKNVPTTGTSSLPAD